MWEKSKNVIQNRYQPWSFTVIVIKSKCTEKTNLENPDEGIYTEQP